MRQRVNRAEIAASSSVATSCSIPAPIAASVSTLGSVFNFPFAPSPSRSPRAGSSVATRTSSRPVASSTARVVGYATVAGTVGSR
ncbi:hypothetical protein [Streptomyces sp. YGL11-2]|uniref:hypothetical protein n=1 Tax=Streptomyces sp. YGL11-2 TaxID=3414028 RepID=UPI003CF19646